MAGNQQSSSGVLKRLESEVTCPLCLEIFTEPKKLPCEHVYCAQCLRGLALRSITGSISCPECRTDTPVPPNFDVTQFVTPHQVNRLIEMYQQNLKLAETEAVPAPQPATCKVHMLQPLALYCETCESLVCRDCVIESCARNHEYGYIDKMVEKYRADLSRRLEPVQNLHQQMSNALDAISAAGRKLNNTKESKLKQAESTFDALAEILAQERLYITESIKKSYQEQEELNSWTNKKSEIAGILAKLATIIQSTENALLDEPKPAFLRDMANKRRNIERITELARDVSPQPTVLSEMQTKLLSSAKFKEDCHFSNFLYAKDDPLKGHFERLYDFHNVNVNVPVTLYIDPSSVKVTAFKKINISAHLRHCHDGSSKAVTVKKITPEQYSLSFGPRGRGRHELHTMCNDTQICGSPIPICVTMPSPQQLKQISSTKIKNSGGIKCYGGKIYVSDQDTGIIVLNSVTKSIERTIRLPGINEVLVTPEHIYASDTREDRIIKMDMNGVVIKSVGGKGNDPGQFNYPNSIRLSKDKEIFVCDSYNHRIQVFNEDLNLLRVIGRKGVIKGCFIMPDLDFDEVGNIYVAEEGNHRIQVLAPGGQHIRYIGSLGNKPGELKHPISPVIHRDMVFVTDRFNDRISVFKTTGEFVATFGDGIPRLDCIAITEDGYVHVTSNRQQILTF